MGNAHFYGHVSTSIVCDDSNRSCCLQGYDRDRVLVFLHSRCMAGGDKSKSYSGIEKWTRTTGLSAPAAPESHFCFFFFFWFEHLGERFGIVELVRILPYCDSRDLVIQGEAWLDSLDIQFQRQTLVVFDFYPRITHFNSLSISCSSISESPDFLCDSLSDEVVSGSLLRLAA